MCLCWAAGEGDGATDVLQPRDAVELGEDGLDLPGILLALGVGCLQDGDTLDWLGLKSDEPSESDGVAGDGINGESRDGHSGLSTLTSLESSLVGECGPTNRVTGQRVDAVGEVGEVLGQKLVSVGIGVG